MRSSQVHYKNGYGKRPVYAGSIKKKIPSIACEWENKTF